MSLMPAKPPPKRKLTEDQLVRELQNLAANWPEGLTLVHRGDTGLCLQRDSEQLVLEAGALDFGGGPVIAVIKIPSTSCA